MDLVTESTCSSAVSTVKTFETEFADELLRNSRVHPQGRRWSFPMLTFCFILRSLGAKCYDYMRNLITLPAKKTLYSHFQSETEMWRLSLLSLSGVRKVCTLLRKRHSISDSVVLEAVLGIDAMSMEPVHEDCYGAEKSHNHVFLFQLLPLRCEFKPVCLHLMTKQGGNADQSVRDRIDLVIAALKRESVDVRFLATDGDSGYACLHRDMFNNWWPKYINQNLEVAIESVASSSKKNILGDFLHILKNARSRLINGAVTLVFNGARPFNGEKMNAVLKLGKALTDKSTTGKMKDCYALQIFTLENFLTLLRHKCTHMAFYVLPYALWSCAVRSPVMSTQMRRDFLSFVMQIFEHYVRQISYLTPNVSETKAGEITFCCSKTHAVRVLNSLAGILLELTRHPDNVALSRMGTHDLECQFGLVRILCHNNHKWHMILKAFSKLSLIAELTTAFGHPLRPRERDNVGGVKIREDMFVQWDPIHVSAEEVNMFNVMQEVNLVLLREEEAMQSGVEVEHNLDEEIAKFVEYVTRFVQQTEQIGYTSKPLYQESDVSHVSIISRLIAFRNSRSENQSLGWQDDPDHHSWCVEEVTD